MTRNQKIALGCGGAGCLGLIVVVVAGCFIYFFTYSQARNRAGRDYEFPVSVNTNSNTNSDSNSDSNSNSDSSASSLSEDDKHKLYQAASMTGDAEVIRRVTMKIGLMNEDYTPSEHYQQFVAEHVSWAIQNRDFIQSVNTPDKARAYVNEHFPE